MPYLTSTLNYHLFDSYFINGVYQNLVKRNPEKHRFTDGLDVIDVFPASTYRIKYLSINRLLSMNIFGVRGSPLFTGENNPAWLTLRKQLIIYHPLDCCLLLLVGFQ